MDLISLKSIHFLKKWEGFHGKTLIDEDLTGYSRRVAEAMVRDQFHRKTNCMADFEATENQVAWLRRFGIDYEDSRLIAQALIDDVCEQLDWDVISHEGLCIGTRVVHVRNKRKPLVIRSLMPGEKVKFEGTSFTCRPRMLRRYRPDGNYTKTNIPNEYFRKGWLER